MLSCFCLHDLYRLSLHSSLATALAPFIQHSNDCRDLIPAFHTFPACGGVAWVAGVKPVGPAMTAEREYLPTVRSLFQQKCAGLVFAYVEDESYYFQK